MLEGVQRVVVDEDADRALVGQYPSGPLERAPDGVRRQRVGRLRTS
jgi:hypothetical protein